MPTYKDSVTGETKEISMEELMKKIRSGQGYIQQVVKHADGTTTTTNLYGADSSDGLDHSVNIFTNTDTAYAFLYKKLDRINGKTDEKDDEENPHDYYEMTIDFTDEAWTAIIKETKEELTIKIYSRDERKALLDRYLMRSKSWKVTEDGKVNITQEDVNGKDASLTIFMIGLVEMRRYLRSTGQLAKLKELNGKRAGVVISATNHAEDATAKIVIGANRPDLPCRFMGIGEQEMMRPYFDEMMGDNLYAGMTLEEKIKEAENGDPQLMEELAEAYLNGNGVELNLEKAAYWNQKLADSGNTTGMINLGMHYAKGCGVERDFNKAAEWMGKAVASGATNAETAAEKFQSAAKWMKEAEDGNASSQAKLSGVYMEIAQALNAAGSDKDYAESVKWAEKAAEQNEGEGLWILGLAYEHGRGVQQDVKKAAELYEKGADLGYAPAQNSIATFYMKGIGVQKDEKKGIEYYKKSAAQGEALAMKNLGHCYQFGNGVEENMAKAIEWYEKGLEIEYDPELAQKVAVFKTLPDVNDSNDISNYIGLNPLERIDQIVEQYNNAQDPLYVAGTTLDGRADNCERLHVGAELEARRTFYDRYGGDNAIELYYQGKSIGFLYDNPANELSPLMDAGKIIIKPIVTIFTPRSQRGKRARAADVRVKIRIEKEKTEVEEAASYGIDVKDLFTHRKYLSAVKKMNKAATSSEYKSAASAFEDIKGYLDSDTLRETCIRKIEDIEAEKQKKANREQEEYEKEYAKWSEQVKRIKDDQLKRIQENSKKCDNKYQESVLSINASFDEKRGLLKKDIAEMEEKVSGYESELASLNIFRFGRKKELKALIESTKGTIDEKKNALPDLEVQLKKALDDAADICSSEKSAFEVSIDKEKLPDRPLSPSEKQEIRERAERRKQEEEKKTKEEREKIRNLQGMERKVYDYLKGTYERITVKEIWRDYKFSDCTPQQISQALTELRKKGLVKREYEKKIAYFSLGKED